MSDDGPNFDKTAIRTDADDDPDRDEADRADRAVDEITDHPDTDLLRRLAKTLASDDKQAETLPERLRRGDRTLIRPFGHPVSVNEVHATLIGLSIGVLAAALVLGGLYDVALSMLAALFGYAILGYPIFHSLDHDDPRYRTIGRKTIKHEPWYFVGPCLLAVGVTLAVAMAFGIEPDLTGLYEHLGIDST